MNIDMVMLACGFVQAKVEMVNADLTSGKTPSMDGLVEGCQKLEKACADS